MLFIAEAARRYEKKGVTVNAFSPGLIPDPKVCVGAGDGGEGCGLHALKRFGTQAWHVALFCVVWPDPSPNTQHLNP